MSFEKTPDGISVGRYYGNKSGTMVEPTSVLTAYIIDLLEEKFPSIDDVYGSSTISYSWYHSVEPQTSLQSPAVGISISPTEKQTLGSTSLTTLGGSIIPGSLMVAEMTVVIVADSPRMREDISSRMFKILNKYINGITAPIFYFERKSFGDDRGFSAVDKFVSTALWQNVTEDKYVKIDSYEIGYAENYIDEDDISDWGVIGAIEHNISSDNVLLSSDIGSTNITFRTTFTTNII